MPVTFREATLPNGLTIIAELDPAAHSAAAGFFVRTGARDEPARLMGVSHFLEHMMFKGTQTLSAEAINQAFDQIGASNNAYTSSEMTTFYAHTLPEYLPRSIELLASLLTPALRQTDFDTEKNVILEEIAMYRDNPFWVLYEHATERRYGAHGLGHRVLGTEATIRDLPRDGMEHYFRQRYSADNTVLALAGRVDFDAAVQQAHQLCRDWPRTGATRDTARPHTHTPTFRFTQPNVSRAYALLQADAPGIADPDRYPASVLAYLLGGSDNSRLHWALIETGIAEEAQASYDAHDGAGDWFIFASGEPDRIDQILAVLNEQLDSLVPSLTRDDLLRVRSKIATAATLRGERPGDRMQRIGRQWVTLGSYLPLEDEVARINAVTLDDLERVARRFPFTPRSTGVLLPADTPASVTA